MEWHPFAMKFPLLQGTEWESFKESIQKTHGNQVPVIYRTQNGIKQGIDGRNRERACEELGLTCYGVEEVLSDGEVKDFILVHNVQRRHLTPELRREIVAELRQDGKSTRAIAETLGVGKTTVDRDIRSTVPSGTTENVNLGDSGNLGSIPTVPFGTVETKVAEEKKITGKNGKQYKPRNPRKPNNSNGTQEPDKPLTVEEAMQAKNKEIESFCRQLTALIADIPVDPWISDLGRDEGARRKIQDAAGTLRSAKCHALCPVCNGAKCPRCKDTGRMPKSNYDNTI